MNNRVAVAVVVPILFCSRSLNRVNKPAFFPFFSPSFKIELFLHQRSLNHSYFSSKEIKREPTNRFERLKVFVV